MTPLRLDEELAIHENGGVDPPSLPPFEITSKDTSMCDPNAFETSIAQDSAVNGLDFADLSPGPMIAWPWLHEDLFLQQNWTGLPDSESEFLDATSLAYTDMTANFLSGSQDVSSAVVHPHSRHTDMDTMMLAPGEAFRATVMGSRHANDVQSLGQMEKSPIYPQSGSQLPSSMASLTSQDSMTANFQQKDRVTSMQMTLLSELIAYARQGNLEPPSRGGHATYWYSMSMRMREAFNLFSPESPNASVVHCLDHLVHLYRENFWALWPMISAYSFDANNINPILYLAICSIGAMYGGSKASHFGVLLHEALRELLCEPLLSSDESDSSSLSLAQARLLTQVAALYFGQKRAFSAAQHLGSVLVAQTRRMDLYSTSRHQRELSHVPSSTQESPENSRWLARWLLSESRKRLAYGILRAEVYTSVLLNARPMLCAEEIALELPCSNYVWLTRFSSDSHFIAAIRQDATGNMSERLPFSDVVQIIMERNETVVPLSVVSQELLIFGLQEHVWRACHDPDMLHRLTGSGIDSNEMYDGLDGSPYIQDRPTSPHTGPAHRNRSLSMNVGAYSLESRLTNRSRRMVGLRNGHKTTASALYNWRQLLTVRHGELTRSERTSLMSGLLLFHISFLRMFAPIEKLHHISYRIGSSTGPEGEIVRAVWSWSQSEHAKIAVQHACIIWSLLFQECSQLEDTRAWFNFLALLGLHHSSVVVWTFAGTHAGDPSEDDSPTMTLGGAGDAENKLPVTLAMSRDLMTMFVRLYSNISPAWSVRSSFSAAAVRLANSEFPAQPD